MKKLVYILLFAVVFGGFIYSRISKSRTKTTSSKTEDLVSASNQVEIKRDFEFPIQNAGKKVSLKFSLNSAQLTNTIANQGKPIKSNSDQQFLIIFLELQNDSQYPININSQDFVRLIGEKDKKYAPDLYNGQIEVAPISVKRDEIGFAVTADKKQFQIQVGEINKDKETIDINF